MKLTPRINDAITARFQECRPRTFNQKAKLVMKCEAISPYPSYREARSLLAQRNAVFQQERKAQSEAALVKQEEAARQMQQSRFDLYQ